jgi:hypothetical protein
MFTNLQYFQNQDFGKDFACLYTDESGTQWHVHGKRDAGESNFRCVITLREQIAFPSTVLYASGIDGIQCLMNVAERVNRFNALGKVYLNE